MSDALNRLQGIGVTKESAKKAAVGRRPADAKIADDGKPNALVKPKAEVVVKSRSSGFKDNVDEFDALTECSPVAEFGMDNLV